MLCVAARALAAAPPRRLCEGRRRVARAKDSRFDPGRRARLCCCTTVCWSRTYSSAAVRPPRHGTTRPPRRAGGGAPALLSGSCACVPPLWPPPTDRGRLDRLCFSNQLPPPYFGFMLWYCRSAPARRRLTLTRPPIPPHIADQIPSPRQDAPLRLKKRSKGETAPTAAARPAPALFGGVLSSETAGHYAIAGMLGVWAVTLLAAPHPIVSPVFSSLGGGEALCLALRTSGVGAACGAVIALMLAQMPGTYRAARIGAAGLALCAMAALGAAFAPGAAAVGLAATATQTATSTALCAAGTLTALLTAAFESAVVVKQIGKARAKANY